MYNFPTFAKFNFSFFIFFLLLFPLVAYPQTASLQNSASSKSLSAATASKSQEGKSLWVYRNPFNRRLFLENVGQFKGKINTPGSTIKYAVCDKETWMYFSPTGLTYRHDQRPELTEREMDKAEFAKNEKEKQEAIQAMQRVFTTFVNMQWLGSNPDVQIETMGEAPDHFSYPPDIIEGNTSTETFIARGFEKITYKNLYKNIDVEYTMMPFEKGGFKYTIILHPGADASVIKMKYSDIRKLKLDREGNITIKSQMGDIVDHAPQTFYKDGATISSQFILNDNIVSFSLGAYDASKTVVIDPWTTTTGAANTNAYDVDFDDFGNVYTYGGPANYQVVKFNPSGVQQWAFNANFNGTGSYGDFAVDQKSQSIYIGESVNLGTGAQVRKIRGGASSATQLAVFAGDSRFNEIWRMQYNPCIGKTVMGGASTSAPSYFQAAMLDTNVSALTPVNMFGASEPYHDIGLLAVDDYGSTYMLTARSVFGNSSILDNSMAKAPVPALSPTTWQISSGLTLVEYTTNTYVTESTSAYNGMAVSPNFLYTYDGMTLKKWNMTTGAAITSVVVGGATAANYNYGGITVDRCDNIYVGFNNKIFRYDVNLVNQATVATCAGNVFDLRIGKNDILYACGASFVQALSAYPCTNNTMTLAMSSTGSCSGTSSATVAVSGGTSPYTYSWSTSPVQTTATASNLSAGTYTVTVTDGSCAKAIATNTITVTAGPGVPVTVTPTTSTICEGASTNLTASGANSYSWAPTTGLNTSIGATVVASPTVTTTYTVTGTTTGCSGTAVTTVNVDPLPTVAVNSPDVCTGQSAVLTASGASTYSWSPATSLSATTGTSVTTTTAVAINYIVTGTSAAGCVNTAQSSVTISTMPSSNAGADITICSGATGNIGAPATVGYVYIWSPTTGLSSSTAPDPTVTLTNVTASPVTSSYTVTTSPAGCSSTDVVNVTVKPKDNAAFSYPSSTVCQTGGTDPVATIAGTTGGTFTFTPAGLSINSSTGLITLASSTLNTYTVTYTTTGLCPDTSSFVISIVNVPVATFSYAGPYCQDATPDPLPTFPSGASAGVFSASPAGLVFVNTATGEVDLSASTPNAYTVTNSIAAGGGCPAATATNTITINAVPVTTVTNTVVCSGVSTTLTAGGATSYVWSDASTLSTLTVSPLNTTSYTVTGTTAGCSSSAVGTVTTNPIPAVTVNSATVCAGTPATLTASGATSYSWSDGSSASSLTAAPGTTTPYIVTGTSAGCSSSATGTITVDPIPTVTVNSPVICIGLSATLMASGATSYLWSTTSTANPLFVTPVSTTSYTVTGTTAGCSASAVSTVTVTQLPVITVNSTTICSGQSSTLTAGGGATYAWSTGASGNTITISPTATTSYTVSDNTPGCSGSATATVTVNPTPVLTVNSAIICQGQSATLTASGANTYLWSTGSVTSTLTDSPLVNTSYTVTGTSSNCSTSASASITVLPVPVITATGASICSGSTAIINANGGTSYVWSSGSVASSASVSPLTNANYTVTGTAGGCSSNAVAAVTVFPIPTAAFSGTPNPVGVLEPVITFTDRSSADVNYWAWDFGDGDSLVGTQNPIHQFPPMEATYTVTLTVQNAGSCPNSISKTVVVGPDFTFYIPNAFSPNDDQKNDVFGASGGGIQKFQLLVFDRWGNQIFSTDDITQTWDGKVKGKADVAQQDVFVWKVTITDVFKKEHDFIGTVTIVK